MLENTLTADAKLLYERTKALQVGDYTYIEMSKAGYHAAICLMMADTSAPPDFRYRRYMTKYARCTVSVGSTGVVESYPVVRIERTA